MKILSRSDKLLIQFLLLVFGAVFLMIDINRPFVDFDEATYAQVVVDTAHSGQFASFKIGEENWFEKPPLFLWVDMASVKVFGEREFAFRIPVIIATLLCCWLTYRIVRKLTEDEMAAVLAFLVLLTSNRFFLYGRELRLDSAVIAAMLAAFYFWLKSHENKKYLLWIFPLIGVGFLIKSVIALLVIPLILIYAFFYGDWAWIRSKYLWYGLPIMLAITLPWHMWETIQFGGSFWSSYVGWHLFQRTVSTITGSNNFYDYLLVLWSLNPWIWVLAAELTAIFWFKTSPRFESLIQTRDILASVMYVLFLTTIFTFARTHLGPYLLPAFPFIAIAIALSFHNLAPLAGKFRTMVYGGLLVLILFAGWVCVDTRDMVTPWWTAEERAVGEHYKGGLGNLYLMDWRVRETMDYYGDTRTHYLEARTVGGKLIKGPFYLALDLPAESYFIVENTILYQGLRVVYQGKQLALLYSDRDLILPQFKF